MTASYAKVGLGLLVALAGCGTSPSAGTRGVGLEQGLARSPFKPRLYVVAIGVSAYEQKEWSLEYGAKDAQEFADFWKTQAGGLYESVQTRVLVDAQATRAAILNALEWVQGQSTQHDVAFIFLAGHGTNDTSGRYYFGPHDMKPDQLKASWVPATDIKTTLDATQGKRILFLDTCYAGNVSGQLATRSASDALAEALNELGRAEDGAVTFGGSSARQRAGESRALEGGIFTRALLEGLAGGADLIRDQIITVKELDAFVTKRVRELSQGRQGAVTPKIDRALEDYPIVVLGAAASLALTPAEKVQLEVAKKHLSLGKRFGAIERWDDMDRENGEAFEIFNMLEEKLDDEGRIGLAWTLLTGSRARDARRAIALISPLAQAGNPRAESLLGVAYNAGHGVGEDATVAARWYARAAQQGDPLAQYNLGKAYDFGEGMPQDRARAVRWYQAAADQGLALAQTNLGFLRQNGSGVTKDEAEAVRWYRKAAEQGYARAQHNLGKMYELGTGVRNNDAEALRWFRKAAEQNYAAAQSDIGFFYETGRSIQKDDREAVRWYRKGAEGGNAIAQSNLGKCYAHGRGVEKDEVEAVSWFRKAGDQGVAGAQNWLGYMYEQGRGMAKDDGQALLWYEKAAAQKDPDALKNLARLRAAKASPAPTTTSPPAPRPR